MKRMTNEDFDNKLSNLYGDLIVRNPASNYKNTKTDIELECKLCKSKYMYKPYNLFQGYSGCPGCNKRKKMNIEDVIRKICEDTNGEYNYVSGEYKSIHSYLKIKHLKCSHIWNTKMSNFFQGKRCPKCSN